MWVRGLETRQATGASVIPPADSGWRVATQLFTDGRSVHVHRAEPRGTSSTVRLKQAATCCVSSVRPLPAADPGPPHLACAAPRRQRRKRGAGVDGLTRIVSRGSGHLRRVRAVRRRRVHVPRRLHAVGFRRWHGAPQQLRAHGQFGDARLAALLLDTAAHEFFHSWNVERIGRARSNRSTWNGRTPRASCGWRRA